MAQEHSSKQYDLDLETLRSRVLEMGGLVESQILAAINGVAAGDLRALDHVIAEDHRVNALEVSIDTDCSHLIARRQPTAGDLRMGCRRKFKIAEGEAGDADGAVWIK